MQKTSVNIKLKHENGTRSRLQPPPLKQWIRCRDKERMQLIDEAEWKLQHRVDLGKFIHDQKVTKVALKGLMSQTQWMFVD